jgi:hypothetical protein
LAGWYWAQHAPKILQYFYSNSFGENKDVWVFRGDLYERLFYYLGGAALQSNLGRMFLPLTAVYLAGSLEDIFRGRTLSIRLRGGGMLWMLLGVTVVNAFFSMKSPYLGGSFYGFIIFGSIWYAKLYLEKMASIWKAKPGRQLLLCGLLVAGAWTIYEYPAVGQLDPVAAQNQTLVNRKMLEDLEASGSDGVLNVLFTQGNPVVDPYLEMEFIVRGRTLKRISAAHKRTLTEVIPILKKVEFVVVQDQKIRGAPGDLIPGELWQPELKAYLDQSDSWKLIAEYPMDDGKKVYLFRCLTVP